AVRDAAHLQEIVEETGLVVRLALDEPGGPPQARVSKERQPQRMGGAHDRRKRVTQLMGEHGEEAVLRDVALLKLLHYSVPLLLWLPDVLLDRRLDATIQHVEYALLRRCPLLPAQRLGPGLEFLNDAEEHLAEEGKLPERLGDVVAQLPAVVAVLGAFPLYGRSPVIPQRSDDRVEERREVIVDFGVAQVQTLAGLCFIRTRRRTPPRDKGLFPRCEVLSKVWVRHEPESGVLCSRPSPRAEQARPRRPAAFLHTSHHPLNRRLTALRLAGQPDSKMKMRLVAQRDGEELVQLATRIPRDIARRLKEFCVR